MNTLGQWQTPTYSRRDRKYPNNAVDPFRILIKVILHLTTAFLLISPQSFHVDAQTNIHKITNNHVETLSNESVVLITGAATHLGSQLVLALHRSYNVAKLILVDELHAGPDEIHLPPATGHLHQRFQRKPPQDQKAKFEQSLAAFEYKRQRIFHVMQTVKDRGYFYRVDFRPVMPQYGSTPTMASTEFLGLPVLNMIFEEHGDITHVVHLDGDSLNSSVTRAVPRRKEDNRMGMMEGLLEQLKMQKEKEMVENKTSDLASILSPRFVYASSAEVYNNDSPDKVKKEDGDISLSSSSSVLGTSKLLDEVLAKSYSNLYDVHSIGLRFFEVYGPWSSPGTPIFELAEHAIAPEETRPSSPKIWTGLDQDGHNLNSINDYIYIDDAVDAILSAMQFIPPPGREIESLIVNVGSGTGHTLTEIVQAMKEHIPRSKDEDWIQPKNQRSFPTNPGRVASMERSSILFGFEPRVSLVDGIKKTLAWHFDRSLPFGTKEYTIERQLGYDYHSAAGTGSDVGACHPSDLECLNGVTILPCISECARVEKCMPSIYDGVAILSKAITTSCETVMYTVVLDRDVHTIDSKFTEPSSGDKSFFPGEFCNLAFVREDSTLVKRLQQSNRMSMSVGELVGRIQVGYEVTKSNLLSSGFWIILPVAVQIASEKDSGDGSHEYFEKSKTNVLPKLSPKSFFSSKYAIYCSLNLKFKDTSKILNEFFTNGEQSIEMEMEASSTLMMLGDGSSLNLKSDSDKRLFYSSDLYNQERMYDAISIALKNNFQKPQNIGSLWIVHSLISEDAREFRCDILGEMINWNVNDNGRNRDFNGDDVGSISFIISLHDFWSTALARWKGEGIWWKPSGGDLGIEERYAILSTAAGRGGLRGMVRVVPDGKVGAVFVGKN